MGPVEYLRVARRRWWVIALAGLLAVVAVTLTTPTKSIQVQAEGTSYTGTHTLFLQADRSGQAIEPNLRRAAFFVTVGEVPRRVARDLSFNGPPAVLAAKVSAAIDTDLSALKITATDTSAERVVAIADTFAKELVSYIEDTERARIKQALSDAQADIKSLTAQIADMDVRNGLNPTVEQRQNREVLVNALKVVTDRGTSLAASTTTRSGFITFESAVAVPAAVSRGGFHTPKSRGGRLVVVGLLGLLVGAGFALVIDRLDTSLHTKEATEAAFGLPVWAEVPRWDEKRRSREIEISLAADPLSPLAQPYRMLRTTLLLMGRQTGSALGGGAQAGSQHGGTQVVLLTPADSGDRQSAAVVNLGARFAESGRSVLIVGCDPFASRTDKTVGREAAELGPGLADVLRASGSRGLADVVRQTSIPRLRVVTPGQPTVGFSLAPTSLVLAEARALAEIVLIDAGSLLTSSEAGEVLGYVDSVVVVAQAGRTTVDAATRVGELLSRFGSPAAGVLLIGARHVRSLGVRRLRALHAKTKNTPAPIPSAPGPASSTSVSERASIAPRSVASPDRGASTSVAASRRTSKVPEDAPDAGPIAPQRRGS